MKVQNSVLKLYFFFGLHSALLKVLIGSSHLEIEILFDLLLLVSGAVNGLVGPVERLAGQGLAGIPLLDQLGGLLPPQLSLDRLLAQAGGLPLSRGRHHRPGLRDLRYISLVVPNLGAGAGGLGGGRVPGQGRQTASEIARGGDRALPHQHPVIGAGVADGLGAIRSLGSPGLLFLAPDVA